MKKLLIALGCLAGLCFGIRLDGGGISGGWGDGKSFEIYQNVVLLPDILHSDIDLGYKFEPDTSFLILSSGLKSYVHLFWLLNLELKVAVGVQNFKTWGYFGEAGIVMNFLPTIHEKLPAFIAGADYGTMFSSSKTRNARFKFGLFWR